MAREFEGDYGMQQILESGRPLPFVLQNFLNAHPDFDATKFLDPNQIGNLNFQDYSRLAAAEGYTGKNPLQFLMGMQTKDGTPVAHGQYGADASSQTIGQGFFSPREFVERTNPDLYDRWASGYKRSVDEFTPGDAIAMWVAGGMAGMGAAGAAAGAGEGAAVTGAAGEGAAGLAGGGFTGGAGGGGAIAGEGLAGGAAGGGLAGGAAGGGSLAAGGFDWGSLLSGLTSTQGSTFGIPNNILAGIVQGGLGYLGSGQQADAYQDVANQNAAIGAPFRNRLDASYKPGFDLASQPGYGDAFDRMADISTRSWSARSGNPANNPGIQGSILNDVWNQSYLPALSNYRGQLGQFGGLGLNTAGAAQLGGAQTAGSGLDAIGYGLGTAINPQPNWLEYMKGMQANAATNYATTFGGVQYGGQR